MNGKTVEKAQLPTLKFRPVNHIGWFKIPQRKVESWVL